MEKFHLILTVLTEISPNFNSFSKKKHKNRVKIEKFTPLARNFTLPPGLTGWTNFTSVVTWVLAILPQNILQGNVLVETVRHS